MSRWQRVAIVFAGVGILLIGGAGFGGLQTTVLEMQRLPLEVSRWQQLARLSSALRASSQLELSIKDKKTEIAEAQAAIDALRVILHAPEDVSDLSKLDVMLDAGLKQPGEATRILSALAARSDSYAFAQVVAVQKRLFVSTSLIVLCFTILAVMLFWAIFAAWQKHVRAQELRAKLQAASSDWEQRLATVLLELQEQREQAHQTHRNLEQESKVWKAVEQAGLALALIRVDGQIVRVNEAMAALTGYDAEALSSMREYDLLEDGEWESRAVRTAELIATGRPGCKFETIIRRADGATLPVSGTAALIHTDSHQPDLVIYLLTADQTEREYLRLKSRWTTLLEMLPAAVVIRAPDSSVTEANGRLFEWTGVPQEEGYERVVALSIHPHDHRRVTDAITDGRMKEQPFNYEWRVRYLDGVYRRHWAQHYPIFSSDGELKEWICTSTDIEAHRRLEDWPDHEIRERMQELEKQKLIAERANQAKSMFLANMSHELRTPLNGLLGFTEVLVNGMVGELTPQQRDFMLEVESSGKHLLNLINDLLDMAKVESGKMEVHAELVFVGGLVREVVANLSKVAEKGHVEVITQLDEIEPVCTDPQMMRQIIYNYLSNAIKFTPAHGKVLVSTRTTVRGISLEVSDSGPGIPPEEVNRLFMPFEQLSDGTAKLFGGTGLGLALVRKLTRLMGGTSGYRPSNLGGSTFYSDIPAHVEDPPCLTCKRMLECPHQTLFVIRDREMRKVQWAEY